MKGTKVMSFTYIGKDGKRRKCIIRRTNIAVTIRTRRRFLPWRKLPPGAFHFLMMEILGLGITYHPRSVDKNSDYTFNVREAWSIIVSMNQYKDLRTTTPDDPQPCIRIERGVR